MKKKILLVGLLVVLVAAISVGLTVAYLTSTDEATNTFTMGDVKIDLIESTYHREGNDNSGDTSIPDPTNAASGMKYVTDGHKAFTDAEIQANAKDYADYIAKRGDKLVPGRNVAKCPYVINTGKTDAFIRIRVLVPSAANADFVNAEDGGVITNQWTSTSMISGEFLKDENKTYTWDNAPVINKGVNVDGKTYDEYVFVRKEALAAGAMTEWNVWNFIGIAATATNADIQKAIGAGAIYLNADGIYTFDVLVQADAIQAEGFADATAAFAAFDKK